MDITAGALVLAIASAFVGAAIQGSIGFGMNLVTVPVLALVLPESLPVAVIVIGLPISIDMLRHEHAALDRAGIAWIVAGRIPGTLLGAWIVATVTTTVLQGFVGAAILVLAAASVVLPPVPVRPDTQFVAGAVSGVTGTAGGIGGPPLALLYQHHKGPTIRSTLAAAFLFGTILSLSVLAVTRQVGGDQLLLGAAMAPGVVAGSILGRRFHDWLERGWLRPAVLAFAAATAIVVIIDSIV